MPRKMKSPKIIFGNRFLFLGSKISFLGTFLGKRDDIGKEGFQACVRKTIRDDVKSGVSANRRRYAGQTVTVTYGGQSVSFGVTVTASEGTTPVIIDGKETGIRLEASEGVVPSDTVLQTEKVTDGENFTIVGNALTDTADKWVAYDIRWLSDNAEIQPNGKVKIVIPRPTELNADKLALFHVAEGGKLTQIPFTLDEATDTVVFETDHFSLYVVAEKTETDSGSSNPPTGYNGQGILLLAVLLMAGAAVLLLRKRRTAR